MYCLNCQENYSLKTTKRVLHKGTAFKGAELTKDYLSLRCPFCGTIVGAEVLPEGEPKNIEGRHVC